MGRGIFGPPSCTSLPGMPDAGGQGEEGGGSRERTQGQTARGGGGRGGGREGRKGVPHSSRESLFIHPPSPLPTRQPQRQPLIRIFMKTRTNGRLRGGKKKPNTNKTHHQQPPPNPISLILFLQRADVLWPANREGHSLAVS